MRLRPISLQNHSWRGETNINIDNKVLLDSCNKQIQERLCVSVIFRSLQYLGGASAITRNRVIKNRQL